MTDAPCHGCENRAVGCHAACADYAAYDTQRKQERETRLMACIEGTSAKRNHERWLDGQRRRAKYGS